jgi:hypothetical protein
MWWIVGVIGLALLLFLVVSALPVGKSRFGRHDFERHDPTEHLYKY